MKKIEIKGKLSLNKSTIASLNNEQMRFVKGGGEAGAAADDEVDARFRFTWALFGCKDTRDNCGCDTVNTRC